MSKSVGPAIVDAALEVARELVTLYGRVHATALEFQHAESRLTALLRTSDDRVAFLDQLRAANDRGEIPREGYEKLLVTIGRLLKSSAALATECERITRTGGS